MLRFLRPSGDNGGDTGGVTTIVAILLAGGVLLGMSALAIDVGRLYVERQELQSGAEAAALAVAKLCAATPAACAADGLAEAEDYANRNATDDVSTVSVLCGQLPDGSLDACPAQPDNLTRCLNNGDLPDAYVEVRTITRMPDGSTLLPPSFAQGILGREGYAGTAVGACARAGFGPPRPTAGIAVTLSICEWNAMTGGGTSYPAPPPYPPNPLPPPGTDKPIYLHATKEASTCPAGPSGWDAPGGFGWLDEDGGPCQATIGDDGTSGGSTGTAVSGTCQTVLNEYWTSHEVLFIPVYDGVLGTGAGTTYHIAGMAAFVLTGYSLPGFRKESWLTGGHFCTGDEKCLYGYFTQDLIPVTGEVGGPDLGATIVTLIG